MDVSIRNSPSAASAQFDGVARYDTASMFVPILVLMMRGIVLTSLVRRAEEHFAPWRMDQE